MGWLTFFTSFSTLFCCALPALLVAIGAGSTLVAILSEFPWLITLSENKGMTWTIAGLLLLTNGIWIWRNRNAPCLLDPILAQKCTQARKINVVIWGGSFVIYVLGVGFAVMGELNL